MSFRVVVSTVLGHPQFPKWACGNFSVYIELVAVSEETTVEGTSQSQSHSILQHSIGTKETSTGVKTMGSTLTSILKSFAPSTETNGYALSNGYVQSSTFAPSTTTCVHSTTNAAKLRQIREADRIIMAASWRLQDATKAYTFNVSSFLPLYSALHEPPSKVYNWSDFTCLKICHDGKRTVAKNLQFLAHLKIHHNRKNHSKQKSFFPKM